MTFDPTKPCLQKNGRAAEVLNRRIEGIYPLVVVHTKGNNIEQVDGYTLDGKYLHDRDSSRDLVNIVPPVNVWVNVYRDGTRVYVGRHTYSNCGLAVESHSPEFYLGTVQIQWEDPSLGF